MKSLYEIILRRGIPVVINSYNQPGYLRNLVTCLRNNDFENLVIVDNASDDIQTQNVLCDLEKDHVTVIRYGANHGPRHFHQSGMYEFLGRGYHFFSDPDINFPSFADNFVERMISLSEKYHCWKVGSALEIPSVDAIRTDLEFYSPGEQRSYGIAEWEQRFWTDSVEDQVYRAAIDTTWHLFNPQWYPGHDYFAYFAGLRVAGPGYTAQHLPWYRHDPLGNEKYSLSKSQWNTWKNKHDNYQC